MGAKFDQAKYRDVIDSLTAEWSDSYKQAAKHAAEIIQTHLAAGYSLKQSIDTALAASDFFTKNQDVMQDVIFRAAASGYGINPGDIAASQKTIIEHKLMEKPWAPDNMNLSARLHSANQAIRAKIDDVVGNAMKDGTAWVNLARSLYDGYSYGRTISPADLPEYLDQLVKATRMALEGHPIAEKDYLDMIKNARRMVERIGDNGAPTGPLKSAFEKLLSAAIDGNEQALDNAVYVALNEKSRYIAERIARTEIARSSFDGYFAKSYNDPDVAYTRWNLSSNHPYFDICDLHARADIFGLGPGVYPKEAFPRYPAHPHCRCYPDDIFVGELPDDLQPRTDPEEIQQAGEEFVDGLTDEERQQLMGKDGAAAYNQSKNWQGNVNSFAGYVDPNPRLMPKDFGDQPEPPKLPPASPPVPPPAMEQPTQTGSTSTPPTFTSYADAEAWAKQEFGLDNAKFDKSDFAIEAVNDIISQISKFQQQLPEAMDNIKTLSNAQKFQAAINYMKPVKYIAAVFANYDAVVFSKKWFSKTGYPTLASESARCKRIGWMSTSDPQHCIIHELGHVLYNYLKDNGADVARFTNQKFQDAQKEALATKKGTSAYHDILSTYGMTNNRELFAEAFAEGFLSSNPRPLAKAVYEWAIKEYNAITARKGAP